MVISACADAGEPSGETSTTATSQGSTTTTTEGSSGQTSTTATTQGSTTTTISAEQLAKAQAVGDITAGEDLFNLNVEQPGSDLACSQCHTLDGVDGRSPSLAGISAVAGERVDGVSDVDYLRESIVDPAAFQEGDWAAIMPRTYSESLSEEQVDDLIAFLLTQ